MKKTREVTWKHCFGAVIILAIVVGVAATFLIRTETERAVTAARYQSHLNALGFAQTAEAWIDAQTAQAWIDLRARQSIEQVIDTMLLGEAAYVQVVLGNAVLIHASDDDWSAYVPLLITALPETGSLAIHSSQGRLLSDVVIPIGTRRDSSISYARIGYELETLAHHLQTVRLAGAGIALAVFLVGCVLSVLIQAWLDHRGVLRSPFGGIVQTLSGSQGGESLILDEHTKQIALHGEKLSLPPKLFQLLSLLVRENGRVLQEDEIVETLWPGADLADSRDIRQCVYLLRKRLEAAMAGAGACIANVKGFGYRYDAASLEGLVPDRVPDLVAGP